MNQLSSLMELIEGCSKTNCFISHHQTELCSFGGQLDWILLPRPETAEPTWSLFGKNVLSFWLPCFFPCLPMPPVPTAINRPPEYPEILMFVCLQKDSRQWCDARSLIVLIVLADEFLAIVLETNKHPNLTRLRWPMHNHQSWPIATVFWSELP